MWGAARYPVDKVLEHYDDLIPDVKARTYLGFAGRIFTGVEFASTLYTARIEGPNAGTAASLLGMMVNFAPGLGGVNVIRGFWDAGMVATKHKQLTSTGLMETGISLAHEEFEKNYKATPDSEKHIILSLISSSS